MVGMKFKAFLAAACLTAVGFLPAAAQTTTFTGSGATSWFTTGNWDNGVPDENSTAVIGSLTTAQRPVISSGTAEALEILFQNSGVKQIQFTGDSTLAVGGGTGSILKDPTFTGSARILVNANATLQAGVVEVDWFEMASGASSGSLTISSGQNYTASERFVVSEGTSGLGTLTLDGGSVVTDNFWFAQRTDGDAAVFLNSGTLAATFLGRAAADLNVSSFQWNGGTIENREDTNLTISGAGRANNLVIQIGDSGSPAFHAQTGQTITVNSDVELIDKTGENGSLSKTGGGTLILNGTHTFSGILSLAEGTTQLNSGVSLVQSEGILLTGATAVFDLSNHGTFTVVSEQTLGGIGTVQTGGNNVVVEGFLDPGNSPGTLTFDLDTGALDIGAAEVLRFTLGATSDSVVLDSGTLDLGAGTVDFDTFDFLTGAGFGPGDYLLFESPATIQGMLGSNLTGSIDGFFSTLYLADGLDTDSQLWVSVVPEPGFALVFLGLLLLLPRHRRSSQSR